MKNTITKDQFVIYAVDCLGFREEEANEIWIENKGAKFRTEEQREECISYIS